MIPRFVFLVHPFFGAARWLMAARGARVGLMCGRAPGLGDAGELARLSLGSVEGVVAAVPLLPDELLADQNLALMMMERAVQEVAPVGFVGLGGVLSVVAGRGVALQEACGLPVTTGNAATSWAAARLGKEVLLERKLGRVAVVGGAGTVGKAVAGLLKEEGVEVVLDPEKIGEFEVILGCHTTGGQLAPEAVKRGAVLIDVALPRTLKKGPAPHVEQLKGESLILPEGWKRDGWGVLLHLVAGYGLNHVYACVIEPLVAVAVGRTVPWAQGKRLTVQTVREFGREAEKLGFVPGRVRLAPFRGAG